MTREFRATFIHENGWWIGWTDDLRGANAQERTLEEARASLKEAIAGLLDIQREDGTGDDLANAEEVVRETLVVDAA
jgi:predicted RNase H-like HicB family nuclease